MGFYAVLNHYFAACVYQVV